MLGKEALGWLAVVWILRRERSSCLLDEWHVNEGSSFREIYIFQYIHASFKDFFGRAAGEVKGVHLDHNLVKVLDDILDLL